MDKQNRKAIIAGNWKMNKTATEAAELIDALIPAVKDAGCEVVICVPFTDLVTAVAKTKGTNIHVGAENVHFEKSGAFTGEISADMLTDLVAKRDNVIDLGKLEYCVREDLNRVAQRRMAVLNPLKVVITNYEEDKTELFTAINNPEDEAAGTRQVPFSKVIWIERDDFMENPPKKFFRLSPGGEVRLRYSYLIKCEEVVKDEGGNITELRCTYDPMSGGGSSSDGRRVKGVIHWVSARPAFEAEIRLFNPLFTKENPDDCEEGQTWEDNLNPESMIVTKGWLEPSLAGAEPGRTFQFERVGYFCPDTDSTPGHLVFNRTVTLKDSWAKINK